MTPDAMTVRKPPADPVAALAEALEEDADRDRALVAEWDSTLPDLPENEPMTPATALWSLMKQGWRIVAPDGSSVPPPAFSAALDAAGFAVVPKGQEAERLSNWMGLAAAQTTELEEKDAEIELLRKEASECSDQWRVADRQTGAHVVEIARLRAALKSVLDLWDADASDPDDVERDVLDPARAALAGGSDGDR